MCCYFGILPLSFQECFSIIKGVHLQILEAGIPNLHTFSQNPQFGSNLKIIVTVHDSEQLQIIKEKRFYLMFRFICVAIFLVVFLILSIPIFLVEWVIGKFNREKRDYSSLRIVQWAFHVILKMTSVQTTVIGEENVPDEPVLFIGNHRSFFDILLTYSRCKRLTGYVAKKEMEHIPLLSTWMRYLYCLFLDRENPKEGLKTILQAIDYVKNGISVCIFPEGTRNKGEELSMLPFKDGAFKIATKTNCAIIPISMNNTSAIFENQFPKIRKVHVVIEYGKPIYPNDLDKDDKKHIGRYVQNIIQETIHKNAEIV